MVDRAGERNGKLTVLRRVFHRKDRDTGRWITYWECLCDCGRTKRVRSTNLKRTKSCGECIGDLPEKLVKVDRELPKLSWEKRQEVLAYRRNGVRYEAMRSVKVGGKVVKEHYNPRKYRSRRASYEEVGKKFRWSEKLAKRICHMLEGKVWGERSNHRRNSMADAKWMAKLKTEDRSVLRPEYGGTSSRFGGTPAHPHGPVICEQYIAYESDDFVREISEAHERARFNE